MAAQRIKVDGFDITGFVTALKWAKNDIDASNSGRDMNGAMRRARVAEKAKLQFTCRTMTHGELMELSSVIGRETVSVTYLDPRLGQRDNVTFYGSSIDAAVWQSDAASGETLWASPTFNLIEV